MARTTIQRLKRTRDDRERGSLILDILIGMAIFALIAFIAATAVNQYRQRAYKQGAMSDVKSLAEAIQASRIDGDPVPAVGAVDAGTYDTILTRRNAAEVLAVSDDGEGFALCVEHDTGAYGVYDSTGAGLVAAGTEGGCPTSYVLADGIPGAGGVIGDEDDDDEATPPGVLAYSPGATRVDRVSGVEDAFDVVFDGATISADPAASYRDPAHVTLTITFTPHAGSYESTEIYWSGTALPGWNAGASMPSEEAWVETVEMVSAQPLEYGTAGLTLDGTAFGTLHAEQAGTFHVVAQADGYFDAVFDVATPNVP